MKKLFTLTLPTPQERLSARRLFCFGYAGVLAAILLIQGCSGEGGGTGRKPTEAVAVVVATAVNKTVPIEVNAIGNVEAFRTISVRAQAGGELARVNFSEGEFVQKGQLLFEIDKRPYEAEVSLARANVAKDTAQLSQAKANLSRDVAQEKYATVQARRYSALLDLGVISSAQNDQAVSQAEAFTESTRADQAAIESAQSALDADKATLERAQLELDYCTIRSPLIGRTGAVSVKEGNLVIANGTELTTINQVQPIYVTFSVPERYLSDIRKYMAEGQLAVLASPQGDSASTEKGSLTFVDNTVDLSTGTIKLKGLFQNEDRKLWPGQFVNATLRLATQPNAVVVPAEAIQTGQDGQFVFFVKQDLTVEMRPVETGIHVDPEIVVEKGLQVGERVVTEGQLRLVPGTRVAVRNGQQTVSAGPTGPKGESQ